MKDLGSRIVEFMDRSEDFPTQPIPRERRKPWYSIAMVWTGIYISIAAILDGLAVISGLTFKKKYSCFNNCILYFYSINCFTR